MMDKLENAEAIVEEVPFEEPKPFDGYVGSVEVNPDQKPLKNIDMEMFNSKEEIDKFLLEVGNDAFVDDVKEEKKEEAKEEEESKEEPKEESKETIEDELESKEPEKDSAKGVDPEIEAFLEGVSLTKEQFDSLPEKAQEKLTEFYSSEQEIQGATKVHKEYTELLGYVEELEKDPYIQNRIEELAKGGATGAVGLPDPTKEELKMLMDAAYEMEEEELSVVLKDYLAKKGQAVVSAERVAVEARVKRQKLEEDALAVVVDMIGKESRIGIKEKNLSKIKDGHPDYQAWKGEGGLFSFFQKHKLGVEHIKELGSDKLLALLAKDKGWDKEREKKIYNSATKSLLTKLREAKDKARTIDMGKKSAPPKSSRSEGGFERESLVADIASGTLKNWERLLELADQRGDRKMMSELFSIREEAETAVQKSQTPSDT